MPALAKKLSLLLLGFSCLLFTSKAQANPVADTSLPIPSLLMCSGNNCTINNGTPYGSNLFHSFKDFSVPTGGVVYFNNASGIANIITRVTGTSISNIDGLLKTNGTANLFLLNPNGIVFGTNARLDIGGSFLASTGNAIKFADSTFYTTKSQSTPVLTVSVPIGLQFGSSPGSILVQGQGQGLRATPALIDTTTGLHVNPNQTLALVGGDVVMQGGTLKTAGGRIELGSVGDNSFVSLNPIDKGWALGYSGVSAFRDIQLSAKSAVDASGAGGGDVQVQGRNINLSGGSEIQGSTLGSQSGGTVAVTAQQSIQLIGIAAQGLPFPSGIAGGVLGGSGTGSNLIISTGQLLLDAGAQISTSTLGGGGNAGNLTINTGSLTVRGGSQIDAFTNNPGAGGNIIVNASDLVQLIGTSSAGVRSGLFTTATGTGAAGNITINTSRLTIQDGARASTSTRRAGSGGILTVNATDSVQLSGISPDGKNPSGLFALSGELGPNTKPSDASGAGGFLNINTGQLNVSNGAQVSVSAQGSGTAGNLNVTANSVNLDNIGSISAETKVGTGGNINLQTQDLRMRHNSGITTSATGTASGGNITLNADTLVALEHSNIAANAVRGRGGNVIVSTQGIFNSPDSAISASSELGVNGVVEVKTFGFDVKNTFAPLTNNFTSTEQVVAGSCLGSRNREQGTFVVTGTGGLRRTPYDPIAGRYTVTTVQPIGGKTNTSLQPLPVPQPTTPTAAWKPGDPIVEAQAIVVTPDGRTLLATIPEKPSADPSKIVCHEEG